MTNEKPFDITSELNALADQVQQDREAGVFLGKGQPPIVSELSRQLRASIRYDAINGTATERAICGSQMIRAADRLDHLEAENARLLHAMSRQQHDLQIELAKALGYGGWQEGQLPEWGDHIAVTMISELGTRLTATTSRAEQAERERDEYKRLWHQEASKGPECQF